MSRSAVTTRVATSADVPVLARLWRELRDVGGRVERAFNPTVVGDVVDRFEEVVANPACRVVLACAGDEPAGMAVVRVVQPDPLSPSRVVVVSHLVVSPGKRRTGVGRSLVAAAADYADESGVEHVAVRVYPSLRDASRFYARLGFAPLTVQRVAPVALLRRRLGQEPAASARVDDLVRRRSRLRRRVPPQRAMPPVRQPID